MSDESCNPDLAIENMAKILLYSLTQLPGGLSAREKKLGEALYEFMSFRYRNEAQKKGV